MAWIEKYNLNISDIKGKHWYTKIYKENASTGITTLVGSGNPIVFEYCNESDDIFSPLKEVKVNLNVINPSNFYLSPLYSYEPKSYKVNIYSGDSSSIYWCGYIDTQNYSEPYDTAPNEVTIKCNSGLDLLKDIEYKDTSGNYYNGRKYESQIILDILNKIDASSFKEYVNLYESNMIDISTYSPFDQLTIDVDVFKDMYCDEVLKHLLSKYNACITQKNGIFHIYRPNELSQDLVFGRYFTDTSVKSLTYYNPTQYLNRSVHNSNLQHLTGRGNLMIQPPIKKISLTQDYGNRDSWLDNWQFSADNFDGSTFQYWTVEPHSQINHISYFLPNEKEGVYLIQKPSAGYWTPTLTQTIGSPATTGALTVPSESEIVTLEFEYGYYNNSGSSHSLFNVGIVQIKQGFYYLDEIDNTYLDWTYIPSLIEVNTSLTASQKWSGWTKYSRQIVGFITNEPIEVKLVGFQYPSSNYYMVFKNVKLSVSSAQTLQKKNKRSLLNRIKFNGGFSGEFDINLKNKYYYTSYKEPVDNIVERTYIPTVSASFGREFSNDYILGDVADTSLYNVLNQFKGSLGYVNIDGDINHTSSWHSLFDSSKLLLQLIGDEISKQYSRPKQFIQIPFYDNANADASFNVCGNLKDEKNNSTPFAFNRGTYEVKNRFWNADFVEIIPYNVIINYSLSTNPISHNFANYGGDISINVTTQPYTWWLASDACTWLSVTDSSATGSGHFHIQATAQTSGSSARSGRITIDSSAGAKYVAITQDSSVANAIQISAGDSYETYKYLTWNYILEEACSASWIDVSANCSYTIEPTNYVWTLSQYSGDPGITRIYITYNKTTPPESDAFDFMSGLTSLALLDVDSFSACP